MPKVSRLHHEYTYLAAYYCVLNKVLLALAVHYAVPDEDNTGRSVTIFLYAPNYNTTIMLFPLCLYFAKYFPHSVSTWTGSLPNS